MVQIPVGCGKFREIFLQERGAIPKCFGIDTNKNEKLPEIPVPQ